MDRSTITGLGVSLLILTFTPATMAATGLDGVYCSLDPSYSFRMDAEGFVDARGTCRTISTKSGSDERSLIIKNACPNGVRSITVVDMHDSALVAIFEDGNEYHLARCP